MKDVVEHLEYAKLFFILSIGMIAFTYLAIVVFRRARFRKFITGIVSIIIGLYGLLTIDPRILLLDDINNITIFVIGTGVGLVGIFVSIILEIYNKGELVINHNRVKKSEKTD